MILASFRAMLEGLAMIFYYYTSKTAHFYVNLITIFFIENSSLADVTIEAQVKLQMCSYLYQQKEFWGNAVLPKILLMITGIMIQWLVKSYILHIFLPKFGEN